MRGAALRARLAEVERRLAARSRGAAPVELVTVAPVLDDLGTLIGAEEVERLQVPAGHDPRDRNAGTASEAGGR